MKKIPLILLILLFLFLTGCENKQNLQFTENEITIELNESVFLPLQLQHMMIDEVDFEILETGFFEQNENTVTGLQVGTTLLIVRSKTNPQLYDTITIIVIPVQPILHAMSNQLEIGKTIRIDILNFEDKNLFTWHVDHPEILHLNSSFIVEGLQIGTATISVTHKFNSEVMGSFTIEVIPVIPRLYASTTILQVGDHVQLLINSDEFTHEDFNWTISDSSIISMQSNYQIQANKVGVASVTITLKSNPLVTSQCEFQVGVPSTGSLEPTTGPLYIKADNNSGIVRAGASLPITIAGQNNISDYRYLSADSTIVAITDRGIVHGIKAGITKIYVMIMNNPAIRGELTVTVQGEPNVNYPERLIQAASAEIGYVEGPNNENKFGVWFEYPNVAWCAIFVSWSANQAGIGIDVIPKYSSVAFGMLWFQERELFQLKGEYTPKPGDIIFFASSGASHTGIVTHADQETVYTVEGNTGNGVYARSYPLDYRTITGYGTPNYPPYQP